MFISKWNAMYVINETHFIVVCRQGDLALLDCVELMFQRPNGYDVPLDVAACGQDRVVVLVRDLVLDDGFRHPFQLLDILLHDFIIDFSLTDITIDFRI